MGERDRELVQQILSGNKEAFSAFYDAYFHKIYNYVYYKVRDHAIAEDLTQETFISFAESLRIFEGKSSLRCWVFSISRNTVNNWFRKRKRETAFLNRKDKELLENVYVDRSTPLSVLEFREFLSACRQRLRRVAPQSRGIFFKKHFRGMTIKEISTTTRKTEGAVKTDLYRTKKFLINGRMFRRYMD